MEIITVYPRGFGANSYILTEDGKTALVIDPAQPRIEGELLKRGLRATHVLLTHCHFDHVGGVSALQQGGARVYCSQEETPLVGTDMDLAFHFGATCTQYSVEETFVDGEEKILNGISVKMLLTPGHTQGSCCYLVTTKEGEKHLFSGDTLFMDSIGRTDFPTGSVAQMQQSLRKLARMEDMPVYPGHNDPTTISREKKYNPFMQE